MRSNTTPDCLQFCRPCVAKAAGLLHADPRVRKSCAEQQQRRLEAFKNPLILPSVERRKFSICVAVTLSQVLGGVQKTLAIETSPSVRCLVCMATCPLTKLICQRGLGFVSGRSVFRIIYRLPAFVQPARGGR